MFLLDIFLKWENLVKYFKGFMEIEFAGLVLLNFKNLCFGYKCGYWMWNFKSIKDIENIDRNYLKFLRLGRIL